MIERCAMLTLRHSKCIIASFQNGSWLESIIGVQIGSSFGAGNYITITWSCFYRNSNIQTDCSIRILLSFVSNSSSFKTQVNLFEHPSKVGCIFLMDVVSILPHAEFGRNDHREDVSHFNYLFISFPQSFSSAFDKKGDFQIHTALVVSMQIIETMDS